MKQRHSQGYWRAEPPKTQKSYRTIPLTDKAYSILKSCYDEKDSRKESETLSQILEYIDSRTGEKKCLIMHDLVFVNWRTGEPAKNSSYDTHLYKLCDEAGIKRFCMHALRHTYATRAIERGVQPKVLQQLLGHASIKTTMDRYVHVTDESLVNAIRQFQQATPPVTKKGRTRNLKKGENPDKSRVFGQVKDKMKLGIVGLPNVGKSTLFNSLTKAGAESANYPFCTIDPNVGVVAVPDERLKLLGDLYHSKKVTPAVIEFVDIAGLVKGASKGEGLGNQFLSNIREVDAIVHVVRCFEDSNVVHVDGNVNPLRDIETINLELIFSDLEILERRIAKVAKGARMDKDQAKELAMLERVKERLEDGKLAIGFETEDEDEEEYFKNLNLLTAKPVIYAANVGEEDLANDGADNAGVQAVREYAKETGSEVFAICAQIEEEISELDDEERQMFLDDLGLKESGLEKLIRASYHLLGLMSFLTSGEDETRAWTIKQGTKAPQAAGKIHTDFERGFIKAEVVNYKDLLENGSLAAAREKGLVRMEGKEYVVQDGDVILFRFNV